MESPLCEGGRAPGLKLIETLLWDGTEFRWLDSHLDRMARGAVDLAWGFDTDELRGALWIACRSDPRPLRVRLTLDRDGAVAVQTAPTPPPMAAWRVGLANQRLDSRDPWLRLKTTRRPAYDAARLALTDATDEVVLLNERDEVCDGTITTLFFDRGQGMRTTPLTAGLLPGILRAQLIADGTHEETLLAADLPQVRLWVGNSLRGLIPAIWSGVG